MEQRTLEDHNGKLAVVYRATSWTQPEKITYIWPTEYHTKTAVEGMLWVLPQPVYYSQMRGCFYVRIDGREIDIPTEKHSNEPLVEPWPCPKVRRGQETRYEHGEWQVYSKTDRRWRSL